MEKEEFTTLLKDRGYDASVIDGVVMVNVKQTDRHRVWRDMRKMALESSFDSSMGISISST